MRWTGVGTYNTFGKVEKGALSLSRLFLVCVGFGKHRLPIK